MRKLFNQSKSGVWNMRKSNRKLGFDWLIRSNIVEHVIWVLVSGVGVWWWKLGFVCLGGRRKWLKEWVAEVPPRPDSMLLFLLTFTLPNVLSLQTAQHPSLSLSFDQQMTADRVSHFIPHFSLLLTFHWLRLVVRCPQKGYLILLTSLEQKIKAETFF